MTKTRRAAVGWGVLFGLLCVLMLVVGLETALHFLGPAIDGPFQLYNSLRRIAAGQQPGVAFQFFHGMGIPYLHYPFFRLFGGTFIASEVTRELVSTALYPIVIVVFLKFFLKDWTRTLAWSAIVMAGSIALRLTSILVAINSLLGVRSTLPTLMPVVLCLPVRRTVRNTLAAATLGGAFLLGTEQGMAAALALIVVTAIVAVRSADRRAWIEDAAIILAGGVATLVVLLVCVGGWSGMRGAIRYNFTLVPMDQYWYFGSPPNRFLSSWSAVPEIMASLWRIPIVLAIGVVAVVVGARRLLAGSNTTAARREFAFAFVLTYGLISCASLLGTWVNAYIQPLLRVLLLVGACLLNDLLPARDEKSGRRLVAGVGPSTLGLAAATLLLMVAIVPSVLVTTMATLPHMIEDHVFGRVGAVYAGIWPTTISSGQAMLDVHRTPDGKPPTLWSTYAGLLEARNGLFNPTFDYIIHALGPENRVRYVEEFRRRQPTLVQTVHPEYTQYESWIEQTSWDFYAELLRNYEVVGNTDWSLFWQRTATPAAAPTLLWKTDVRADADGVQLPMINNAGGDANLLLQVEIDYVVHNPLRVLPVVGTMPRYLVFAANALQKNPVSLNPYVMRERFPLLAVVGKAPVLHWGVFGLLPGASIRVSAIRVYAVPTSVRNKVWLDALITEQTHVIYQ